MIFNTAAYCGLFCESCPLYKETERFLNGEIDEPDEICRGCNSDTHGRWCSQCDIKACAKGKDHRFCFECAEYPCSRLKEFAENTDYPYHEEIYENLKYIKKHGPYRWEDQQKKRWSCHKCGTPFHWWQTKCPECGAGLSGYLKPVKT